MGQADDRLIIKTFEQYYWYIAPRGYPRSKENNVTRIGWVEPTKEKAQAGLGASSTWRTRYQLDMIRSYVNHDDLFRPD